MSNRLCPYTVKLPIEFWTQYGLRDRARDWCSANIRGTWVVLFTVAEFQYEEDAVFFSLRWL